MTIVMTLQSVLIVYLGALDQIALTVPGQRCLELRSHYTNNADGTDQAIPLAACAGRNQAKKFLALDLDSIFGL